MTEVHVPISVLRLDLKNAQEHYNRVKEYHTALALQKATRAFENFFANERKVFVLVHG